MQSHRIEAPDSCEYDGAVDRALQIHEYWRERGQKVEVTIESQRINGRDIYVIRSSLVDGVPCHQCRGRGEITRKGKPDACPVCAARAESEWRGL
jgi:hypothetical protein